MQCPKHMFNQLLVNLVLFLYTNLSLLGLVYSAWKRSMNEFALVTQVQRVTGCNSSCQMNGFDRLWPAQSGFPSILFVPAQMHGTSKFSCLSAKNYWRLIGWQWFRLSLNQCPLWWIVKLSLVNRSVSWQINTGGEPGDSLWPSEEGSEGDHALKQP